MDRDIELCLPPSGQVSRIAIVGGGFGGTVVLANLVDRVAPGSVIDVFEASGIFGPGLAYGTSDPCHLLNVPAGRMGAFAPEDFLNWLSSPDGKSAAGRFCPGTKSAAEDYLPRALYGCYLKDILAGALRRAAERHVHVSLLHGRVFDAKRGRTPAIALRVEIGRKRRRFAYDALVLATGNRPPRAPKMSAWAQSSRTFIGNPWSALQNGSLTRQLKNLSAKRTVMILGSGLTAVDTILSLDSLGFRGRIVALSRHGLLPARHTMENGAAWSWTVEPDNVPPTAKAFFRWLKNETRTAGAAWRCVFNALRPLTQPLWHKLPEAEQIRLLRHHTLWSIHRHRMAPEVADKITRLRSTGRLDVIAGSVISLSAGVLGLQMRLQRRRAARRETIRPSLILNCTGPDYALSSDELLGRVIKRAIAKAAPNQLGFAVGEDGALDGDPAGRIFAIGAPIFGSLFETTAVPELREQARSIAERIAAMTRPAS